MADSSAGRFLDDAFRALFDATRRAVLARLITGPATVTDLAAPFDMALPSFLKLVRLLERSGWIAIRPETLAGAQRWLQEQHEIWEARYVSAEEQPGCSGSRAARTWHGTADAGWSTLASMVARVWHGYTSPGDADAYEAMLKPELLPGLSSAKGFRGSYLLRRPAGDEVEFITIILWDSLDDIKAIAGADYERAVIPEERRSLLTRCDQKAAHYEVTSSKAGPLSFL